jgi:hypothetical protein
VLLSNRDDDLANPAHAIARVHALRPRTLTLALHNLWDFPAVFPHRNQRHTLC